MAISRTNDWITNRTTDHELKHPDFALESYTDPKDDATHVVVMNLAEIKHARVERRAFADALAVWHSRWSTNS